MVPVIIFKINSIWFKLHNYFNNGQRTQRRRSVKQPTVVGWRYFLLWNGVCIASLLFCSQDRHHHVWDQEYVYIYIYVTWQMPLFKKKDQVIDNWSIPWRRRSLGVIWRRSVTQQFRHLEKVNFNLQTPEQRQVWMQDFLIPWEMVGRVEKHWRTGASMVQCRVLISALT